MKFQVEIGNDTVRHVIEGANIFYWADRERVGWNPRTMVLTFEDTEDDKERYRLTRADFEHGLAVMAKECPVELAAILADDGSADSYTGDALIQCAAFGELKYG